MNLPSVLFTVVAAGLVAVLPRRTAVLPLILAAAYTTRYPVFEIGPANLSVLRTLVLVGLIRIVLRGEWIVNRANTVDRLVFAWGAVYVGMSAFHTVDAWTFRIGMVLGGVGVYTLFRVLISDANDVEWLFRVLCVAMLPLAALMLWEKYAERNPFALIGALAEVNVREGHVRAHGPFGHALLAGSVGASLVPMAFAVWRKQKGLALTGLAASAGIVYASASSGPLMMLGFTFMALAAWRFRSSMALMRWATVAFILALSAIMKDPVYFLMARIDLVGGSTGWHRAQLIRASLEYFHEWWAVGTDYTRHWMPTGIQANEIHADLTNHFIQMGVWGGLPLLSLFIGILAAAFVRVGRARAILEERSLELAYLSWTTGAMLFGQVMNFWASSPFDQSEAFFYLVIAAICAVATSATRPAEVGSVARTPVFVAGRRVVVARARRWQPARALALSGEALAKEHSPNRRALRRKGAQM